jgi:uroporphyrinogen decarboxylase
MNSKERVQVAFNHQEPDRVPIWEWGIDNPVASQVLGRDAWVGFAGDVRGKLRNSMLIQGKIEEFRAHATEDLVDLTRKLGLDIVRVLPEPKAPAPPVAVSENQWRFENRDADQWFDWVYLPETREYTQVDSSIRQGGIDAFERWVTYLESLSPSLDAWSLKELQWVLDQVGQEYFVLGHADVMVETGSSGASWVAVFLESMAARPELVERYLDVHERDMLMLAEAQLQLGVDGLAGGTDWAGTTGMLFSPQAFARFVLPRLKRITDLCHRYGKIFIKHTDGNVMSIEKPFLVDSGIDGFAAIEPRAGMDIAYLKKAHGDRLTFVGNVDCAMTLVYGSEEEVITETRNVIQAAGTGGGLVLASSNSIHPGVPLQNYLAMLDAGRRYGQYPLTSGG